MQNAAFEELYRLASTHEQACVMTAAAELDCWTAILQHRNSLTAAGLAAALQTDPRGTAFLLDALAAMGCLEKTGVDASALYSVPDTFAVSLDSRHPDTIIPLLRHLACVQRSWVQLAQIVKEGVPAERPASILGKDEDDVSFILGMNSIARNIIGGVIESMREAGVFAFDKEDIAFIDIGGASGTYTQAFLHTLPRAVATIFDLPVGISEARKRFSATDLENRVQFATGDFYKDPLPEGFDFAWISAIIHQQNREQSRALYRAALRSLRPGGKVAVRDFIMDASRTKPLAGAFFGINMLVNTRTGMVYTFDEVKEDLEQAGFVNVRLPVPAETMSAVVVAHKPT